jgi:hypothetical protein
VHVDGWVQLTIVLVDGKFSGFLNVTSLTNTGIACPVARQNGLCLSTPNKLAISPECAVKLN